MNKIIGVIGTRKRNSYKDYLKVKRKFLWLFEKGDFICSGKCPKGGDRFAVILANFHVSPERRLWFPSDWEKYKTIAGFIRNTKVARISEHLIACVAEDRTGGTEDTITKFIRFHGKETLYIIT